ncbi:glycolipid transfer protein [Exidia glandulosa HHB12029]|uniref:Glycolipid transfer protein n=1 Tax=Exidia glandulosa HHB12029 TaxID=1314781 RepID=A0A165CSH2_EXIGL|nr:glycolipid transfer protein [Exidia glandulosa HHB12029]KZV83028.1 glycolipid transfer protein [Exidia glandulosa HHB12029]
MSTYFDTVSKSFTDVPVTEDGVDTVAFLEASEGLVKMFDLLGSTAFGIVQKDLQGNITKVRARYDAKPTESKTLESLVKNEWATEKKRTATEGLLWLLRGLNFTCTALRSSHANPSEELAASFNKSYEGTLKKHHSFVVRPLFTVAMKACPYRADFYAKLGSPQEKVNTELGAWTAALDAIVKRLEAFYEKGGYGKGPFA